MRLVEKNLRLFYAHFLAWQSNQEGFIGRKLWNKQLIRSYQEIQEILSKLILSGTPFVAGKIGANEQNLLHWGSGIKIPTYPWGCRGIHYRQTKNCASNAGIVPRTPSSYHLYYELLSQSLAQIDVLGIWYKPGEYWLASRFCQNKILERCYFFDLEPFFTKNSWANALTGKKVFLVTPFLDSCIKQHQNRQQIWTSNFLPEMHLDGYKFPYLFGGNTLNEDRDWINVYHKVTDVLDKTDFDIALIGCGGLSLPIAAHCKFLGKQAIHLGGATQLLFGIRASRYEVDPKYAALMNKYWIRPTGDEKPEEYMQVEDGCYW